MNPTPQIIIGNSQDQPVDSLYAAYQKYNQHAHAAVQPPTFLGYAISIGDTITLRGSNNIDAFGSDSGLTLATITNITDSYIEVSRSAQRKVEKGLATIDDSKVIPNLKVNQSENRIYFVSNDSGFLDAVSLYNTLPRLLTASHTFPYEPAESLTIEPLFSIPLILMAPQAYRLNRFIAKLAWQENSLDILLTCRLVKNTTTGTIAYSEKRNINTVSLTQFDLINTLIPIYPDESLELEIYAFNNLAFMRCQIDFLTLL